MKVVEINPATDDEPAPSGTTVTPAKYGSPDTSGFKVTIGSGENKIDLSLVSEQEPSQESVETSSEETEETPAAVTQESSEERLGDPNAEESEEAPGEPSSEEPEVPPAEDNASSAE